MLLRETRRVQRKYRLSTRGSYVVQLVAETHSMDPEFVVLTENTPTTGKLLTEALGLLLLFGAAMAAMYFGGSAIKSIFGDKSTGLTQLIPNPKEQEKYSSLLEKSMKDTGNKEETLKKLDEELKKDGKSEEERKSILQKFMDWFKGQEEENAKEFEKVSQAWEILKDDKASDEDKAQAREYLEKIAGTETEKIIIDNMDDLKNYLETLVPVMKDKEFQSYIKTDESGKYEKFQNTVGQLVKIVQDVEVSMKDTEERMGESTKYSIKALLIEEDESTTVKFPFEQKEKEKITKMVDLCNSLKEYLTSGQENSLPDEILAAFKEKGIQTLEFGKIQDEYWWQTEAPEEAASLDEIAQYFGFQSLEEVPDADPGILEKASEWWDKLWKKGTGEGASEDPLQIAAEDGELSPKVEKQVEDAPDPKDQKKKGKQNKKHVNDAIFKGVKLDKDWQKLDSELDGLKSDGKNYNDPEYQKALEEKEEIEVAWFKENKEKLLKDGTLTQDAIDDWEKNKTLGGVAETIGGLFGTAFGGLVKVLKLGGKALKGSYESLNPDGKEIVNNTMKVLLKERLPTWLFGKGQEITEERAKAELAMQYKALREKRLGEWKKDNKSKSDDDFKFNVGFEADGMIGRLSLWIVESLSGLDLGDIKPEDFKDTDDGTDTTKGAPDTAENDKDKETGQEQQAASYKREGNLMIERWNQLAGLDRLY